MYSLRESGALRGGAAGTEASSRVIAARDQHRRGAARSFFSADQLREMGRIGARSSQRTIEHSPSPALRELEGEIAEARAGVHEPIVEPPLIRAPANVREGAISHGLHLVKTSREVLEDRLAALPDATLRALAGVTGDEEG